MKKSPAEILRNPRITEKGTQMASQNKVVFEVDKRANKHEIKQAVEEMYKVKVIRVNTSVVLGKFKRVRFQPGYQADRKKAIITLAAGSKIELT
jgi:large subunit ribosomal protein L23